MSLYPHKAAQWSGEPCVRPANGGGCFGVRVEQIRGQNFLDVPFTQRNAPPVCNTAGQRRPVCFQGTRPARFTQMSAGDDGSRTLRVTRSNGDLTVNRLRDKPSSR